MTIQCDKCKKHVDALPIHDCERTFENTIKPIAYGLSERETRNLRFVWDKARSFSDNAVEVGE